MKENIDSFIQSLLIKYITARIDIKNVGNKDNSVKILNNSDLDGRIDFPNWFKDETGSGLVIQSNKCFLYLELKCINDGLLEIYLKGMDIRDKNNKNLPIYIDYTKLTINNEDYLKNNVLVSHDKPFKIEKNVKNGEIIKLYIEWLPLNDLSNL